MTTVLMKPERRQGERLSLDLIEATILWLMQQGKAVSERSVRDVLGGSPNDILPLMRRWYEERAPELLAGRLVVMDQSSVPEPVLVLYRAILEEAGRAADERVASRLAAIEESAAAQEAREMALKREADELAARARTLDAVVPALRAELDIARKDVEAQRLAIERVQVESRERIAAAEAGRDAARAELDEARRSAASLAVLRDAAEGRVGQLADANTALKEELMRSREDTERLRTERSELDARHQGQIDALQAAAASQRVAHQREVEAIKERHGDAAARWADQRLALDAEIVKAKDAAKAADEARDSADAMLRVTEEMLGSAQGQLESERKLRKKEKERLAKLEVDLRALEGQKGKGSERKDPGGEGASGSPTGEP